MRTKGLRDLDVVYIVIEVSKEDRFLFTRPVVLPAGDLVFCNLALLGCTVYKCVLSLIVAKFAVGQSQFVAVVLYCILCIFLYVYKVCICI
jgi:hypothetical protein